MLFAQTEFVRMEMGQRASSNCTIGPQLPHGSVCPGPQTPFGAHDGYNEEMPIRGFGQLHVSGTGWGRYGQLLLSPQRGFDAHEGGHDSPKADELATPYYYKVRLLRYGVLCEVAPSHHSAIYRFTYDEAPEAEPATILFDVAHNIPEHIAPEINGRFLGGDLKYDPRDRMITGYGEYKGGFGDGSTPYKVYFALYSDNVDLQRMDVGTFFDEAHRSLFARIPVNVAKADLQIAVSMRSTDNAKQYLQSETIGRGFDGVKASARKAWDDVFSAITINGTDEEKQIFYTSMYFANVMPRDRFDDNPRWLGVNFDDHYCIWDTWRTKYPLMTLLNPDFTARTVTSFINRFQNEGRCNPTYTSSLDWEDRQGGDDCENVVADAMVKKVEGFDRKAAYEYVKWNALNRRSPEYQRLGWQPETGGLMSCSNALEYAYNDYCASLVAREMKDKKFARQMLRRSHSWQKLYNSSKVDAETGISGFINPRREDGSWVDFDQRKNYASWVEFFYEGNSWTYTLFTPHDFPALIKACGGKQAMVERLKYGFDSELVALWNEPGFLTPFIFSHCDRPDLTAEYVNKLRKRNFSIEKGFCDNEDSGAMGSWFIFTGLGFFPNAGQDYYYLLPPAYTDITVQLPAGRSLHITREGSGTHIKSVTLNGKRIKGNTIRHKQLAKGGELHYCLTSN